MMNSICKANGNKTENNELTAYGLIIQHPSLPLTNPTALTQPRFSKTLLLSFSATWDKTLEFISQIYLIRYGLAKI